MRTDNTKNVFLRFFIVLGLCLALPSLAHAKVSGQCAKCHTMHNSQDGTAQVHIGAGAGWTGGVLIGPLGPPQGQLLKSDCVGCHSTTGSDSIVNGTTPIVWNIGGNQASDLAAGNFSWVVANEGNGHNVLGISATADSILAKAPGQKNAGCANSCHTSLFTANTSATLTGDTGCKGCHLHVGHHDDTSFPDGVIGPEGGGGDAYRFLGGHGVTGIVSNNADSSGGGIYLENSAWKNNLYMSQSWLDTNDPGKMSIGNFCAGCHDAFHAAGGPGAADPMSGEINQNASGSWLRHPTNVYLNSSSPEIVAMMTTAYDPNIPLAREVLNVGASIWSTDQVMCLSCHKAHGTAYADALRFSYATITAHTGGPNRTDGCFFCHRAKDD